MCLLLLNLQMCALMALYYNCYELMRRANVYRKVAQGAIFYLAKNVLNYIALGLFIYEISMFLVKTKEQDNSRKRYY